MNSTVGPDDLTSILNRLTAQQSEIAAARPLPEPTLRSLLDDFTIRYAHHTTALEGNTLTLEETQVVLEHGVTIGGKTVREHLEVLNVRDAWERLKAAVAPGSRLTEDLVLDVHKVLMKGILEDDAGRYRRVPVYIRGSMDVPPNWAKVPDLMAGFAQTFGVRLADEHPIHFAARAHVDFVGIHPFSDGNGRTARMLVNFMLMREGWPPALYAVTDRAAYLRAIRSARTDNDLLPIIRVTAAATSFMIDRYLHAIRQVREGESAYLRQSKPQPSHDQDRGLDRSRATRFYARTRRDSRTGPVACLRT